MRSDQRIAVVGATGRAGRHVVDVLEERGYDVVAISRSAGVDVITGEGLAEALAGVATVVDAATGPSPDEQAATEFFAAAARNLQQFGARAGVGRIVALSIIGADRFTGGYGAAKQVHEQATLSGPVPAVSYVPSMRTQLVAAAVVGEAAADLATGPASAFARGPSHAPLAEIAGPRAESLVGVAGLLASRRDDPLRIEAVPVPAQYYGEYEDGLLLPSPHAVLAGPTFEEWLAWNDGSERTHAAHGAARSA
jgi:hypothetical protein